MSLRALRRSWIAALTVGASLAVASSASAIPVPIGSSTDAAYSGTGTPKSVYSLYNLAANGLIQAQNLIVGANALAGPPTNFGSPVDTNFTTKFTKPSDIDKASGNAKEIATDVSTATNNSQMEMALCVFVVYPTQTSDTSQADAYAACHANNSLYLAAAVAAYTPATTSGTIQNLVATAYAAYPDLDSLVTQLGAASGTLDSMDTSGVNVSSSGTVVSTSDPFAYDIKLSAPAGGYIIPSAFSLTFPAGLSVNTALVSAEINAAANGSSASAIAAVEANPSGTSIGTVTLTSPVADNFGGTNNQLVGKIYVVTTGATSGQGSATQPYLELWLAPGIYDMGSFPSSLSFPLTLNFGEAQVLTLGQLPIPLNSLELNFPAATSPVKTSSCTTLGTTGATATDAIANLALEFGDTTDGLTSASGTPAALTLSATPTAVTNQCTATVATPKNTISGSMGGLNTGSPTLHVHVSTPSKSFSTVTIGLPKGLSFVKAAAKKLAKEVSGAKSAKIAGGKLVVTLKKKATSATVSTKKGLISESSALVKSIKKKKTKKLVVSVHAGSVALTVSIKA